jgi:hypothetical protein
VSRAVALIAAALSGDFAPHRSWLCSADAPAGGGGAVPAAIPPQAPAPKAAASAPAPGAPAAASSPAATPAPPSTPTTPAATETPPAAPAKPREDPIALNLAKLAAGEKKIAAERAKLTADATALTQREKALADATTKATAGLEALRERAKKGEHDAVLAELGLDYSTITRARLRQPKAEAKLGDAKPEAPAPQLSAADLEKAMDARVEALLAKREADAKKAQEDSAAALWTEATQTFEAVVKSGGVAKFEFLTEELAEYPKRIHDALREIAIRSPELTYEQAATKIEEVFAAKAAKRASSAKVRALLEASKHSETDLPRAQAGQATPDVPGTLTNALASERASSPEAPSKAPLSAPSRIRAQRAKEAEEDRRIEALSRR